MSCTSREKLKRGPLREDGDSACTVMRRHPGSSDFFFSLGLLSLHGLWEKQGKATKKPGRGGTPSRTRLAHIPEFLGAEEGIGDRRGGCTGEAWCTAQGPTGPSGAVRSEDQISTRMNAGFR